MVNIFKFVMNIKKLSISIISVTVFLAMIIVLPILFPCEGFLCPWYPNSVFNHVMAALFMTVILGFVVFAITVWIDWVKED